MKAGDTLIIRAPGASLDSHLWIIISDPTVNADRIVIVNVTTYRPDKDQACIVDVGDHEFIKHKSCIEYKGAKIVSLGQLRTIASMPEVELLSRVSDDLLRRIRDGVPDSRMKLDAAAIIENQSNQEF